jgi:hypothetical protein
VTAPPDATALAAALRGAGIACEVEARAALALIVAPTAADATRLAADDLRRRVLALAREHGFTHVAVELGVDGTARHAPVLRH